MQAGDGSAVEETLFAPQIAQAIVKEINALRRSPKAYAEEMHQELEGCYNDKVLTYPSGTQVETVEGAGALADCLQDLRGAEPLVELQLSQAMCSACGRHLADLAARDFCSHIGSDGSTPEARLAKAGEYREQCGENAVFGMQSAREVVYHMLLDDGSPERGHRLNLLNADFRYAGLAHGRHPSADTATVLLLADRFRAKRAAHAEKVQGVLEDILGQELAPRPGETAAAAAHKAWDQLMQDAKPRHLQVPRGQQAHVEYMARPQLYAQARVTVPTFPVGNLLPKPSVDPVVVRALTHRVDHNHDDLVTENEIEGVCHRAQLPLSQADIVRMFDEILERRPPRERTRRSVDWAEIYSAVQPHRRWVPAVDVHVERGDDKYQLVMEAEALLRGCRELRAEISERRPGLELPEMQAVDPNAARLAALGGGGRKAGARLGEVNAFLQCLLVDEALRQEPGLQALLARPGAQAPAAGELRAAVCMGQRRLWAYQVRPHRAAWLQIFGAVGLNPVVPLSPGFKSAKPAQAQPSEEVVRVTGRNMARGPARYSGLPPGAEKMAVRDLPPRVQVRSEPAAAEPAASRALPAEFGGEATMAPSAAPPPWEERRLQTEAMVNQCLSADADRGGVGTGPGSAQPAYTFDARRKFLQVMSKQQRASDEQAFLARERASQAGLGASGSSLGLYGSMASSSRRGLGGSAPPGLRGRGAGSHSLGATGGVRGHFHSTAAIHTGSPGHGWPQSLEVQWDGEHIDHTKAAPQKADLKFSTMTREERDRQFSTYFGKSTLDNTSLKAKAASGQTADGETYQDWRSHDFRADQPHRHGKHGRRHFDPQVREKPVPNRHFISELENKPQEEQLRQHERAREFLDRSLPQGQQRHFQQYMPQAEQPSRHVEFASRRPLRFEADGDMKRHELGFGQVRHSGPEDMMLHSRPLGTSHMDRLIPMA